MTAWDRRNTDEQARERDALLADWLPTVLASAPAWRTQAERLGIAPDRARDLPTLQRLPALRERDLVAEDPAGSGLVQAPATGQVQAHAPPGLLGRLAGAVGRGGPDAARDLLVEEYRPLQAQQAGSEGSWWVVSSRSDLDRMHRAGARTAAVLGLRDDDVVVSAVRCGPTLASVGTVHLAMGAGLPAVHPRTDAQLEAVVDAIRTLAPSVVVVEDDDAEALLEALVAARAVPVDLRRLVLIGPPPDAARRERLTGTLAAAGATVAVRAAWAPPESRVLWAECAAGTGLHTQPDLEHLEVVDPFTGQPTDADGDLTLTSLAWHGTALVRYRTGVWIDPPVTEACPHCDRRVPRLVGPVEPAAWQPSFRVDGRVRRIDLRGVSAVLARTPGMVDWRVELFDAPEGGDRLLVEVAGALEVGTQQLAGRLETACGAAVELRTDVAPDAVAAAVERAGGLFADRRGSGR